MRLAACFGVPIDLIEPCGFPLDDRRLQACRRWITSAPAGTDGATSPGSNTAPPSRRTDGWCCLTTAGRHRVTPTSCSRQDDLHRRRPRKRRCATPKCIDAAEARIRIPMRAGDTLAQCRPGRRDRRSPKRCAKPDQLPTMRPRPEMSTLSPTHTKTPSPSLMSSRPRRLSAETWFRILRHRICQAFEDIEDELTGHARGPARLAGSRARSWTRDRRVTAPRAAAA